MRIVPAMLAAAALGGGAALVGADDAEAAPSPVTIARGTFTDSAEYTGSGTATVTRRGTVRTLRLARNFRADPESITLRMYLATNAAGATHLDLGPMRETGAQSFRVPRGASLSRYRYAIAWCAEVDEPITQAKLAPVR
jgi:hypothetical protein